MKTITLNLPETLFEKIELEVDKVGFAGKSDFLRFLAINYFMDNKKDNIIPEIEDEVLSKYEKAIATSLHKYLQNPKNIYKIIHVEE